jgi:hypothetical protein
MAMLSPASGFLRGLRAACLGVVGLLLALVGHLAAGGVAPQPAVLLLLAGLLGVAGAWLTRVRLSPIRIGMSLAGMQVLLHEVFMLSGAPAGCLMTGVSTPAAARMGGGQPMLGCAVSMAHAGMGQPSALAAPAMVVAHVAATAVMAALLAHGEAVLWFLAECVRRPRWIALGAPGRRAVGDVRSCAPRSAGSRFARGGVGRRGPPTLVLFAIV